ncbi:hypothetical protein EDB83DRAFT_2529609 [Lactarius deliciosus]|nr:hypothetical protein EDB83DRAFT_2529609 [Lactarius deliciosus]
MRMRGGAEQARPSGSIEQVSTVSAAKAAGAGDTGETMVSPPSGLVRQPHGTATNGKSKMKDPPPMDPAAMYESLKGRIAVLEEEVFVGEEEHRYAEEAQKHVRGLEENTVHVKYIENDDRGRNSD